MMVEKRKAKNGEALAFLKRIALMKKLPNKCVLWPFGASKLGYGRVQFQEKIQTAHRVSLILSSGTDMPDKHVLHLPEVCHNRLCVNPKHLRWGTPGDNIRDRKFDGTDNSGERNGRSKLTSTQVREIRKLAALGNTHQKLADIYGVKQQAISKIVSGKRWGSV